MRLIGCPKCGDYFDGDMCEGCGYVADSYRKLQMKKFKRKLEDSNSGLEKDLEKGKGNE